MTATAPFLPFASPEIGEAEIAEVVETAALRLGDDRAQGQALRGRLQRLPRGHRPAFVGRQLGDRRPAPRARGARRRPGRRGHHHHAHVHRHRRGGALPRRRREAGRHRPGHALHRPERRRARDRAEDAGHRSRALRRPRGRHAGHPRHRRAPRPRRRRGRGACAAGDVERPACRHAGIGCHRLQLLRQQDDHDG